MLENPIKEKIGNNYYKETLYYIKDYEYNGKRMEVFYKLKNPRNNYIIGIINNVIQYSFIGASIHRLDNLPAIMFHNEKGDILDKYYVNGKRLDTKNVLLDIKLSKRNDILKNIKHNG